MYRPSKLTSGRDDSSGHLDTQPGNRLTESLFDYVTSSISRCTYRCTGMHFGNKIDKWQVIREEVKSKPCRAKRTEERKETFREANEEVLAKQEKLKKIAYRALSYTKKKY